MARSPVEFLTEKLRQIVCIELHFYGDPVANGFCLEPHQRTVMAVEPFTHFPKSIGKLNADDLDMDDPHTGTPTKVLALEG